MLTYYFKIDNRYYKMVETDILGKQTRIASYALERKIQKMIEQERWLEVKEIDGLYEYYLPREVDDTDEREVRESIEDVAYCNENGLI